MEVHSWCSKFRTFNFDGNLSRGSPKKSWSEKIRSELKKRKASNDLTEISGLSVTIVLVR